MEGKKDKNAKVLKENNADELKKELLAKQIRDKMSTDISDESEVQEAVNLIAATIGGQYFAIYHIWLKTFTFICFQEKMYGLLSAIGVKGDCNEGWGNYIRDFVAPEDQKEMFEFCDFSNLAERLRYTNSIAHVYFRKGVGWTRGQFIVAKRDEEGNVTNVIYTVSDINDERERKIKQKKAIYEAQHDPLTGVYNRNGFDEMMKDPEFADMRIGFALVDVDNFKTLNDNYGHDVGDQVLKRVAECITDTFLSEDCVFRFGGDEFGIVMKNCDQEAWNTICKKIEHIHRALHKSFPDQKNITMSVGVHFNAKGYNEQVFLLADEALYETKRNGRSGCTLIDDNHEIIKRWRDEKASLHAESALDRSTTGMYRVEFSPDKEARMVCNETSKMILGVDANATPEECYKTWIAGIDPSYIEALRVTRYKMLNASQAECTYLWNHPVWGPSYIRSGGYGEIVDGVEILYGYHHALKDTEIVERRDDNKKIIDAMNGIFFASYYVDLKNNTYSTIKATDYAKKMLAGCQDVTTAFKNFIETLVKPEYIDKVREFCNQETLGARLKNQSHIDCEYESKLINRWCQASFIPADYDKDGEVQHMLFVISQLDANRVRDLKESISSKKSLEALFNNVPGGIVMYEWNGERLKTLHISDYYAKQYGLSIVSMDENKGGPNFARIHPDDVEGCKKAILESINGSHYLEYVYRVWNNEEGRYVWVKANAFAEPQSDGTSLIYAMYSDITQQKEAEQNLEKSKVSLSAALNASNQLCYEYDPIAHTGECYSEENFFELPKRIENYPDSLKEMDLFHPDDADLFIETAHTMDDGTPKAHCDVRIKRKGEYGWYSCMFTAYNDPNKGRNVVILTVFDISIRMSALNDYEERIKSILGMNEKSLTIGSFNLTKNTYKNVRSEDEMLPYIDENKTFEELMMNASNSVVGEETQRRYRQLFKRENLLKLVAEGQMNVQIEHLFRIDGKHTEWLQSVLEMMKNPITGEIVGVCYSKSIQDIKLSKLLLKKTAQQDYPMMAVVFAETDEYYTFNAESGSYNETRSDFWSSLGLAIQPVATVLTAEQINEQLYKEKIIKHLNANEEFSFAFDSSFKGERGRSEIKFSYLDDAHSFIFVTLRNITDAVLINKLRHDSEHDALTDLYNRRTIFRECRKLLNMHPDDNFAMVHVDMKHFHLYNNFFGDEVGDKLLCDIADMFRWMDADYDYWVYGRIEADIFCAFLPFNQDIFDRHIARVFEQLDNYRDDFLIEPKFGVYFVTDKTMPVESMFTRATIASKYVRAGRPNAIVVYTDKMERKLVDEQQILNEMQLAIEREEFKVYLQPKYSLKTNKPIGAGALVRWEHPKKGIIQPGQFISIFERNGFISVLDRYMWEQVCKLMSNWRKEGRALVPISVNVSRISMYNPTTVKFLKDLVDKYDIPPRYLELELTETAYMDNPDEMKFQLTELRNAGFKILMDDFGSGYSALNTLRDLPVDCLKLDMKFLATVGDDLRGNMVVSSVVKMSKLLELYVIAEGVETEVQAEFLTSIGCEYVQGYLFAKPMPVAECEQLFAKQDIQNIDEESKDI